LTAEVAGAPPDLSDLPGVHDLRVDGVRVQCEVDTTSLDVVLRRLTDAGVIDLSATPPTLEELFLRHYQGGEDSA
jgi:ABC-2 type transport system ATP-binding protein